MEPIRLGDPNAYAVVWREAGGPVLAGKLELGADGLRLEGSGHRGLVARRRLEYADLAEIRIGREPAERINGLPSLILERGAGQSIAVAVLESPGAVFELSDVLANLTAERATGAS